jgi:hypothetical protein
MGLDAKKDWRVGVATQAMRTARLPKRYEPEAGYLMTRLGGSGDGGYIIPVGMLANVEYLLSLGLGMDWEFERQFDGFAMLKAVHCYDHTVTRARVYRRSLKAALKTAVGSAPRKQLPRIKLALSYAKFFGQKHVRHYQLAISDQDTDKTRSLKSALQNIQACEGKAFLKCDIEGHEYAIIDQMCQAPRSLMGMVVEFHDIIAEPERFHAAIGQLLERFAIVHIHPNNWGALSPEGVADVLEISLIDREWANSLRSPPPATVGRVSISANPRELDAPNTTKIDDIAVTYR